MPNWRHLLLLVAVSLVLALAATPLVRAQDAPVTEPAPSADAAPNADTGETPANPETPEPEPEVTHDKAVAAFGEALDQWADQIKAQEEAIALPGFNLPNTP